MEDLTPAEEVRQNPKCDRRISMYGYVRGVPLKQDAPIHIPGKEATWECSGEPVGRECA